MSTNTFDPISVAEKTVRVSSSSVVSASEQALNALLQGIAATTEVAQSTSKQVGNFTSYGTQLAHHIGKASEALGVSTAAVLTDLKADVENILGGGKMSGIIQKGLDTPNTLAQTRREAAKANTKDGGMSV